jgi:hypothetical protein
VHLRTVGRVLAQPVLLLQTSHTFC